MIGIIVYKKCKKKKQEINIENITKNQSLYPNQKYILSDILDNNE